MAEGLRGNASLLALEGSVGGGAADSGASRCSYMEATDRTEGPEEAADPASRSSRCPLSRSNATLILGLIHSVISTESQDNESGGARKGGGEVCYSSH